MFVYNYTIMLQQYMMGFHCFIILTDLTELSVEFCVDEVFEDRGGLDVRRRRRGKSSILGMPKAPQVNIQGGSSI